MSSAILATKLYMPPKRPNTVLRPRLLARLNEGINGKLTLVSAPAGFGKTTLVSEWVSGLERPVCWLSLDEGDNDPTRFLTYFIAALQSRAPGLGEGLLGALESPQPPPIDSLLTPLVNEMTAVPEPLLLVLDDYHLLDNADIDRTLAFIVENLPPRMHLVLVSREDPNLPLPRLRVRGQLTELRAADLRFTVEETADFFSRSVGLSLTADDIHALEARTEGWVAGLQMAALALQGPGSASDAAGFIESFSGSHRFVLDYLVEEVLQQQPEPVQEFLLKTAVLDRFCWPLCEAVLADGSVSVQETLGYVEQANLFVVPLDNERRWFRYHHLFADLLRQRLQQMVAASGEPGLVDDLHRRASHWFEANGLEMEAFQQAVAANDIELAKRLVEDRAIPLYFRESVRPILDWLKSLPRSVLDGHPALWVTYAVTLTLTGQTEDEIGEVLAAAEASIEAAGLERKTADNLHGRIASIRAMLAIPVNDGQTMMVESQKALKLLDPADLAYMGPVNMTLGYAHMLAGDRPAARQAAHDTISVALASDNEAFALAGYITLGGLMLMDNELRAAEKTYQKVLALAGARPQPYVCAAYMGLTQIAYEWNDWQAMGRYAGLGIKFGVQLPNVEVPAICQMYLVRQKLAEGTLAEASELLDEAEQFFRDKYDSVPLLATRVRLLLAQGQITAAAHLITGREMPLIQARILLAQGRPEAGLALLEPHRMAMLAAGFQDVWLQAQLLTAVLRQANGERETALELVEAALTAVEGEGFVRTFLDEGPLMASLLADAAVRAKHPDYVGELLAVFEAEKGLEGPVFSAGGGSNLVDPLSERELEVLALVAAGLSNKEIGERLFLALDTVKGHNRRIYGKLQVSKRTEAVARARELGLL